MGISTILKRSLGVILVCVQGLLAGLVLNFLWYLFLSLILGWGDSGPDWYMEIQGYIHWGLFLAGMVGWAIFYIWLNRYLDRKDKLEGV
jgi:hypothetical protein